MVDLAVHQNNCGDARIPELSGRLQRFKIGQLRANIRGGVEQHPIDAITAYRYGTLGSRFGIDAAVSQASAVSAITVPLGEATAGGRAEYMNKHNGPLFDLSKGIWGG